MSTLWTSAEAAAATGGEVTAPWEATGVSIDTRSIEPGDLFVALTDARDGHDFVADAFAKGAAAALVTHRPEGVAEDAPLLIVPDVLEALGALGIAARARTRARIVAITGSVGKTSTKSMLQDVLEGQGRVHAAEKSFNNHWGVPLTLARMPSDADFAVVEIGMSNPGEIAPLSRMTRPHVAIVTTVAAAHLEAFGAIEGIAHEKASIFEGLEPGGTAILNGDIGTTPILVAKAEQHASRILTFGERPESHHRLTEASVVGDATVVRGRAWRTPVLFRLGTAGRHFAVNAMAVLAAVWAMGGDRARAVIAFAQWHPPGGRGQRERLALDLVDDHLTFDLIDDAFNAIPASMAAALDVLAASDPIDGLGRIAAGRRVAVLGDMLELGEGEAAMHAELADHPAMARIDVVHCVGPRMRTLWDALPPAQRGQRVDSADDLMPKARSLVDAGDIILVKGSKASRVSRVVEALKELGHPAPAAGQGSV